MAFDGKKLAVWIVVVAFVTGAVILRTERHDRAKHRPASPVVVAPAPVVPPSPPAPEPVAPPVVVVPPPPAAEPTPAPDPKRITKGARKSSKAPKRARVIKATPKPRPASAPNCTRVPAQAYQFPADTVLAVAKQRGTSEADLALLRTCLAKNVK